MPGPHGGFGGPHGGFGGPHGGFGGPHGGFGGPHGGFGGPPIMIGPHHHIGMGVGPGAVIIGDPLLRPPPPPMYGYGYGYGPRYYDDGEVVCCCEIF